MNEVISTRRQEVRFILDSIDDIEALAPGLEGQIDRDRLVVAGHSMGGGTAMALTGVRMDDPRGGPLERSDAPDRHRRHGRRTSPEDRRPRPLVGHTRPTMNRLTACGGMTWRSSRVRIKTTRSEK